MFIGQMAPDAPRRNYNKCMAQAPPVTDVVQSHRGGAISGSAAILFQSARGTRNRSTDVQWATCEL
jgi:hypothetical protein